MSIHLLGIFTYIAAARFLLDSVSGFAQMIRARSWAARRVMSAMILLDSCLVAVLIAAAFRLTGVGS